MSSRVLRSTIRSNRPASAGSKRQANAPDFRQLPSRTSTTQLSARNQDLDPTNNDEDIPDSDSMISIDDSNEDFQPVVPHNIDPLIGQMAQMADSLRFLSPVEQKMALLKGSSKPEWIKHQSIYTTYYLSILGNGLCGHDKQI